MDKQKKIIDLLLKDPHNNPSTPAGLSAGSRQPLTKTKRDTSSVQDDTWRSIGYATATLSPKKSHADDIDHAWVHSLRKDYNFGKINKTDIYAVDADRSNTMVTIDLRNKGIDHKGVELLCEQLMKNVGFPLEDESHDCAFSTPAMAHGSVSSSVDLRLEVHSILNILKNWPAVFYILLIILCVTFQIQ